MPTPIRYLVYLLISFHFSSNLFWGYRGVLTFCVGFGMTHTQRLGLSTFGGHLEPRSRDPWRLRRFTPFKTQPNCIL